MGLGYAPRGAQFVEAMKQLGIAENVLHAADVLLVPLILLISVAAVISAMMLE